MAVEGIVQLRDVCVKIGSGATPRGGKEAYKGGDTSLIRSQNVYNEGFHRNGLVYIDDNQSAELRNVEVKENDVLLNITGDSVARCCQVAADVLPARVNQHVAIIRPEPKAIDARFLRYVLVSHEYQSRLLALASAGATRPALTKSMIEELEVPSPPLAEQKAIAAVLGTLDDKIELNRRMNATLEAMARALFQSWFVDFDPVRAKMDGRKPAGMDDATAALFPAAFQETSLGRIPHGWTPGDFGKIIVAARERIGVSDAAVFSAVASSQLVRSDEHFNKRVYSKSISSYLKVRRWDFAYNPSRINIGSIGMLKESVIGAVSPVYEVFRPKAAYHWFVERALAQRDTKVWIQTLCSGSVRQSLKLRDLESIPLVVPPPPIVQAFSRTWEQWNVLIQANERESSTLATLRDTLLPKLLSGDVRIQTA
jgi:type I restriction enzyme S subunit